MYNLPTQRHTFKNVEESLYTISSVVTVSSFKSLIALSDLSLNCFPLFLCDSSTSVPKICLSSSTLETPSCENKSANASTRILAGDAFSQLNLRMRHSHNLLFSGVYINRTHRLGQEFLALLRTLTKCLQHRLRVPTRYLSSM